MEESDWAVENVLAGEEASEDLRVPAVEPFTADLPGVLAGNQGKIVANTRAPENFIDGRLEEKRLAEPERGGEAHRGVRHA